MPAVGSLGGLATESPCSNDKAIPRWLEDTAVPNMPKNHDRDVCRSLDV